MTHAIEVEGLTKVYGRIGSVLLAGLLIPAARLHRRSRVLGV